MEERVKGSCNSRRYGAIAALIYFLGVGCALWFISFSQMVETPLEEGMYINFGSTATGQGDEELLAQEVSPPAPAISSPAPEPALTDERSEVEAPEAPAEVEQQQDATPTLTETTPTEEVVEPPREVNKRALFPGLSAQSDATSQGATTGEGNAGDDSGISEGAADGTGQSLSGMSYDLHGRSVIGTLPKPNYSANEVGRVVIEVTVDETGNVTRAIYRAQGSTTNNNLLVDAAREAALKARFSPSDNFMQGGTITYTFRLN